MVYMHGAAFLACLSIELQVLTIFPSFYFVIAPSLTPGCPCEPQPQGEWLRGSERKGAGPVREQQGHRGGDVTTTSRTALHHTVGAAPRIGSPGGHLGSGYRGGDPHGLPTSTAGRPVD